MARKKTPTGVVQLPLPTNRAALYLRVSTEDQAKDGYGLDAQLAQVTAYASAFGLEIIETYRDEGVSGTKGLDKRKALAQAIEAASAHKFDFLITASLDRLARKTSLLLSLWDTLENAGISIVCVKERIDTSTAVGRLIRTVLAAIAEFEAENIAARTKGGRDERGKIDGEKGGRVPFGYVRLVDETIAIDEDAAALVRRIFEMDAAGMTLRAIAKRLNDGGYTTARQHQDRYSGSKWYASSIKAILDNEAAYKGGQRGDSPVSWQSILTA